MWMHGQYMCGFWWIFPLLGMALFVLIIVLLVRALGRGAFHGTHADENLRKEIQELKTEIEKVKKQGNRGDAGAGRGNLDEK